MNLGRKLLAGLASVPTLSAVTVLALAADPAGAGPPPTTEETTTSTQPPTTPPPTTEEPTTTGEPTTSAPLTGAFSLDVSVQCVGGTAVLDASYTVDVDVSDALFVVEVLDVGGVTPEYQTQSFIAAGETRTEDNLPLGPPGGRATVNVVALSQPGVTGAGTEVDIPVCTGPSAPTTVAGGTGGGSTVTLPPTR